jgi:plasmid stability protein
MLALHIRRGGLTPDLLIRRLDGQTLIELTAIMAISRDRSDPMPDILIRDVDADAIAHLKEGAASNGRSMQAEARRLFTEAIARAYEQRAFWERADAIRDSLRGGRHSDSAEIIRDGRENDWEEEA